MLSGGATDIFWKRKSYSSYHTRTLFCFGMIGTRSHHFLFTVFQQLYGLAIHYLGFGQVRNDTSSIVVDKNRSQAFEVYLPTISILNLDPRVRLRLITLLGQSRRVNRIFDN